MANKDELDNILQSTTVAICSNQSKASAGLSALMQYRSDSLSEDSCFEDIFTIDKFEDADTADSGDSDTEFNRILEMCKQNAKHKTNGPKETDKKENEERQKKKTPKKNRMFDPEYDNLPLVEDPNIHVEDDVILKKFGIVHDFLDFMAIIKPNADVKYLDFDTLLFNEDRNTIGQVFEIFGKVEEVMYTIRFNTADEARAQLKIGQDVFYAPDEELLTKTVLTNELIKMKISDDGRVDSNSEPEFSDDEAEAAYLAAHRPMTAHRRQCGVNNAQGANGLDSGRAPKRTRRGVPLHHNNNNNAFNPSMAFRGFHGGSSSFPRNHGFIPVPLFAPQFRFGAQPLFDSYRRGERPFDSQEFSAQRGRGNNEGGDCRRGFGKNSFQNPSSIDKE